MNRIALLLLVFAWTFTLAGFGTLAATAADDQGKTPEPAVTSAASGGVSPLGQKIEQMQFPPVVLNIPQVGKEVVRKVLGNGLVVYLSPDPTLPLVNMSLTIRGGSLYEIPAESQVSEILGPFMEYGGTVARTYEQMTELLEHMAVRNSIAISSEFAEGKASCLSQSYPETMKLFSEMMLNPGFREDKLDLVKKQQKESILRQKDYPQWIAATLFKSLLFGEHPYGRIDRVSRIDAISVADLKMAYQRYFVPNRAILAVSGNITEKECLKLITTSFGKWHSSMEPLPLMQKVSDNYTPGYYLFEKDTPQTAIRLGHLSVDRTNPDRIPLMILNAIIGGESFNSLLEKRVRSDEGLAYSVGSYFAMDQPERSSFLCFSETKNEKAYRAVTIMKDTLNELMNRPPTETELHQSKESTINSFIHLWSNTQDSLRRLMLLEIENRPKDYYSTFIQKVQAVTAQDIQRVARQYLQPDKLIVMLVGKRSAMKDLPADIKLEPVTLPEEYMK